MPVTYFVAIRPQSNEHHTVHKEGCPFMPDDSKRIKLGEFKSAFDALNEGKSHFKMSDSCRFCSGEHHSDVNKNTYPQLFLPESLLTLEKLANNWDSALQCCVN